MGVLETIGGLLADAAAKIHITILSGNQKSHSPKIKIVDKSVHNHTVQNNYYIGLPPNLDPASLPPDVKPLVDAYTDKQITFVTADQQHDVAEVLNFEQDPQINSVLKFFKGKLSERDHILLRSGLYLQYLYKTNPEEGRKQWRLIQLNNTARDRRIIKLASADYFSTYFRPLYKEMSKESDVDQRFKRAFTDMIDDMHFVIFVGSDMDENDVIHELTEKAQKNIRYGVRDEIIYIHGAGSSAATVEKAVAELRARKTYRKITTKRWIGARQRVIKASVYYRDEGGQLI